MSVRVSSWVWHSRECAELAGNELVLLIALADVADDNGRCRYVSDEADLTYEGLARKIRVDRRTVERLVPKLRERDLLEHTAGARGRVNEFKILVPWAKRTADKLSVNGSADSPTAVRDSPTALRGIPDNVSVASSKSRIDVGRGASRTRSAASTGTRIPEGWRPSAELVAYTGERAPSVEVAAELERFVDYWTAQAGARGRKADWDATWRTWVRRAHDENVRRGWRAPVSGAGARLRDATAELQLEEKRAWLAARGLSEAEWDAMGAAERREVIGRG